MSEVAIACQTLTFGADQANRLGEVLEHVAQAGYSGFEIGLRQLEDRDPAELKTTLDRLELKLVALHIVGDLGGLPETVDPVPLIESILESVKSFGVDLLMYSGMKYEGDDQLARDMDVLNQAARLSAARGIRFCYHNHDWEFEHDTIVIETIKRDGVPELGFCPDVGWLHKAGVDVLEFLASVKSRIRVIHFKDFASTKPGLDTVELGKGVVPLREAAQWVSQNMENPLVICEQDKADIPPEEAVKQNADFCRSLFAEVTA